MYIVFDIGGTNTRIGISPDGKKLKATRIFLTPKNFKQGIAIIQECAEELANGKKIRAVAGGIAGPLNETKTALVRAPHLSGWARKPIVASFRKAFRAPVYLENDTAMIGLGEAHHGAGRGKRIVAYLSVGTGVGGCRIVRGEIDENAMGFEPGHQVIVAGGRVCPGCGGLGHLESYVSGTAIRSRYGKNPKDIRDRSMWNEFARWLTYGLYNTIIHWSPDIVVLGGSVMKNPGIPIERVRAHLRQMLHIFKKPPLVVKAKLGDIGGLYGSLVLIKSRLKRGV